MDTGVLSIILRHFPYPSHWTRVCSTIMFVLEIVLFLAFGTIYVLRWTLFYTWTSKHVGGDSEEIALQACPAITWLTIVIQVQLTCAESWGYGFTILAYVMWWIGLIWVMSICVILYLHLVKNPSRAVVDKWLPTAVFIPIVGTLTAGNAAGSIVNNAINNTHLGDRLAVPMIIIGFMCVGFALSLGFVMYSIYMHRLMVSGWPEPMKIPAMILTVSWFHPFSSLFDVFSDRPLWTIRKRPPSTQQRGGVSSELRSLCTWFLLDRKCS
jgi:tellurite resistance protein TehA-like permease